MRAADGIFYFWGHSYEIISEANWWDFDRKIAKLSAEPSAQWIDLSDPFR